MSRQEQVLREVAHLVGHPNPDAFVHVLLDPCQHDGEWTYDPNEVCPPPCGQRHHYCACGRPMTPTCPIVGDLP